MERAGDVLRSFLSRQQREEGELYSAFFESWARIAGDPLAAHSRLRDIQSGTVIVDVEHPGWIQLLQMEQQRILTHLRRLYPQLGIRALRLQLARDAAQRPSDASVPGDERPAEAGARNGEPSETDQRERGIAPAAAFDGGSAGAPMGAAEGGARANQPRAVDDRARSAADEAAETPIATELSRIRDQELRRILANLGESIRKRAATKD